MRVRHRGQAVGVRWGVSAETFRSAGRAALLAWIKLVVLKRRLVARSRLVWRWRCVALLARPVTMVVSWVARTSMLRGRLLGTHWRLVIKDLAARIVGPARAEPQAQPARAGSGAPVAIRARVARVARVAQPAAAGPEAALRARFNPMLPPVTAASPSSASRSAPRARTTLLASIYSAASTAAARTAPVKTRAPVSIPRASMT